VLFHSRPGSEYDAKFWQALLTLQDGIWPELSARVDSARALGVHWEHDTTPFAWFEEGRALAHVGVITHPLRLMGKDLVVAGIHAVCADPTARGRGLARRCMQAALSWVDERNMLAKLSTSIPHFYSPWGFSVVPTHYFVSERAGGGGSARPALNGDTAYLRALFEARTPISDVYATREKGWLPIINLALQRRLPSGVLVVPGRDFLIVARQQGGVLHLDDVIGPELPDLAEVLAAIPFKFERIVYHFTPDRLDPFARTETLSVGGGVMQIRGAWPTMTAFGVPSVWEH
jgi:GNAT superfamily N-acetyltransferase